MEAHLPQSRTPRPGIPDIAKPLIWGSTLLGLMVLALAPAAWASLGAGRESIERDRASLAATHTVTAASTHTVHALTQANGVRVREFERPDGTVFAVTWQGQGRPDLRLLLGDSFQVMQADNAPRAGRRPRTPLAVHRPGLLIQSGGHSGAFWGIAYLPKAAPDGFTPRSLGVSP
jgi:hypothetical protein